MPPNSSQPNQQKELAVELDGTFKRGGIPLSQFKVKDVFSATEKEFHIPRGQKFHRTAIANANYTLSTSDYLVAITDLTTLAPSIGLPLPSLVGTGKHFIVKDEVGGAASTTITIRVDGEKLIDGATSLTITTNYQAKELYTDGANYFTI